MAIQDPVKLLERLVAEGVERPWLEFKVNNIDPDEIGEYVSALANAAILAGSERAFLVFGVEDGTHRLVGTKVRLAALKRGGENFENWLNRVIQPRLMLELVDFTHNNLQFSIISIEPTYERPVKFNGAEYIRVGENKRRLSDHPEHERALWMATGRRKFESAIALPNVTKEEVFARLKVDPMFALANEPRPSDDDTIRKLVNQGLLIDNYEGRYDITNLGAILLAADVADFPSIKGKAVRIIKYVGRDKSRSELEQEGRLGYAVGFSGMMKFLMGLLPKEEKYIAGIRRPVPAYPEAAIREIIANALIHQDFTITGAGPVVEIYDNRVEITNPGNSLIDTDRIIDERRSRNEKLAMAMRALGLCEERGGGLDKTLNEIEKIHLPAPDFISSENSMCVVLYGPRAFNEMTKADKQRACFHHCVLRWLMRDYMSNSTLRERFSLPQEEYQAVSAIIGEAVKLGRIAPADPNQGNRNAKYVPYWAA